MFRQKSVVLLCGLIVTFGCTFLFADESTGKTKLSLGRRKANGIVLNNADVEYTLSAGAKGQTVSIKSGAFKESIELPKGVGAIRRIAATWWHDGLSNTSIAIAVECESHQPNMKEFVLITCLLNEPREGNWVGWSFVEQYWTGDSRVDLIGINNPRDQGDSIYIMHGNRTRLEGVDTLETIIYVNDCPRVKGAGRIVVKEIELSAPDE